jgi:hypothetical protein
MKIEGKRMYGGCMDVLVSARMCVYVYVRVGACECVRPLPRVCPTSESMSVNHTLLQWVELWPKRDEAFGLLGC